MEAQLDLFTGHTTRVKVKVKWHKAGCGFATVTETRWWARLDRPVTTVYGPLTLAEAHDVCDAIMEVG